VQTFTSNGTFTVPAGVTKIWVTACAGGGRAGNERAGDGGDWIYRHPYAVAEGSVINITVGKGSTEMGVAGGSTVIGKLVTLACPGIRGGRGGINGTEYTGSRGADGFASGGIGQGASAGGGGSLGRGGDAIVKGGTSVFWGGGSAHGLGMNAKNGGDGIVIIEW